MQSNVTLSSHHQTSIDSAEREVTQTLAEVGAAYIAFDRAERAFLEAKRRLSSCLAAAATAEQTRSRTLSMIADELQLEPGEWVYNEGTLVKRDSHANET